MKNADKALTLVYRSSNGVSYFKLSVFSKTPNLELVLADFKKNFIALLFYFLLKLNFTFKSRNVYVLRTKNRI